jgi:hypothetical protein
MEGLFAASNAEFWQKTMLRDEARFCVFHALIPTIWMTSQTHLVASPTKKMDAIAKAAFKRNLNCCLCGKRTAGTTVQVAIRIAISKHDCSYAIRFAPAYICLACRKVKGIVMQTASNSQIHSLAVKELQQFLATADAEYEDTDGATLWNYMYSRWRADGPKRLPKQLSKCMRICNFCDKQDDTKLLLCGGCKYVRYCNEQCARNMWPIHKHECKRIKDCDFFYPDKLVRLL